MGSSQAPAPGAPCRLCPPPHGSPDPLLSRLPPGAASADRSPRPVPEPSAAATFPAGSASCWGPTSLWTQLSFLRTPHPPQQAHCAPQDPQPGGLPPVTQTPCPHPPTF